MSEPLALLPLALAAGGGRVGDFEAQQLVAAGFTLLRRCAPLVRALSGHRAAILLSPGHAFLTALAASDGRGAVLVNPLAAPPEVAYQLLDANVGAVFTSAALAAKLPPAMPRVLLDDAPAQATFIDDATTRRVDLGTHTGFPLAGDADVEGRDEEAVIVYTSAMLGVPLGAILTHRNLLANARTTRQAAALDAHELSLALLPLAHLFGLTVTHNAPLVAGGRVLPMERFNPLRALEIIESHPISLLVGVPSVFAGLLAAAERRGGRIAARALRVCICGGAPLAETLQERWTAATGVELLQGYGLTEAAPVCLFNRPTLPNNRGALGIALPSVDVTICEPTTGRELPRHETGEICVAGDNVFRGYVGTHEGGLTRRGPWLATGDLGSMDDAGVVTFRGLLKPMFTRNGFNIYPRELERVVAEMPGVRRATVRAMPDPVREHDIALTVEGRVDEADVKRWCESRLAVYKQPSQIVIAPE